MLRQDIRINTDFINLNNDIEWFDSDIDHIKKTISCVPGSYKENPNDGVAIMNYLSSNNSSIDFLKRKLIIELTKDKYNCTNPIITIDASGNYNIDPNINL